MAWTFGTYRIDPERHELTHDGRSVQVEPQVFAAILHLVQNRDRLVTKNDLAEAVWPDGAVSDASISSRIKAARAALGDDGGRQEVIRTVHGLGFRFVAPVAETVAPSSDQRSTKAGRPSVAVLPLRTLGAEEGLAMLAEAIPHEIILALSRLRWIAVTARGSSFRFRQEVPDLDLVSVTLGIRYVVSGVLEATAQEVSVTFELTDCETSEVIWAERVTCRLDSLAELRAKVVARIIATLELHVPEHEARRAEQLGSAEFDAWSSFHVGLRHLYRFTTTDNAIARGHFQRAVALDPRFARAEAGLSFTSFIEAFLRITPDIGAAAQAARRHAERGLELDPMDPFVNFTMGRAYWLTDQAEAARDWLSRATDINPNYAQGFYASGFTAMLIGDSAASEAAIATALDLSPIDPLLYGMYGVRSQMLMQQENFPAAADWGSKAAAAPGAHYLIALIATAANSLAGLDDQATRWASVARAKRQDATALDYSHAFPIRNARMRSKIEGVLRRHGF